MHILVESQWLSTWWRRCWEGGLSLFLLSQISSEHLHLLDHSPQYREDRSKQNSFSSFDTVSTSRKALHGCHHVWKSFRPLRINGMSVLEDLCTRLVIFRSTTECILKSRISLPAWTSRHQLSCDCSLSNSRHNSYPTVGSLTTGIDPHVRSTSSDGNRIPSPP